MRKIFQERLNKCRLYGIIDAGYVPIEQMLDVSRLLLDAGIDVLQLRAKGVGLAHLLGEFFPFLEALRALCLRRKSLFIVNDYWQLAKKLDADGVHIGQEDGMIAAVRNQWSQEVLVGRSTHSVRQAELAYEEGADYIGFGPLFPTPTKRGRPGIGLEEVRWVEQTIGRHIPVFCIGGIHQENLKEVMQAGARRIVVVSELLTASQPKKVAKTLLSQLNNFSIS